MRVGITSLGSRRSARVATRTEREGVGGWLGSCTREKCWGHESTAGCMCQRRAHSSASFVARGGWLRGRRRWWYIGGWRAGWGEGSRMRQAAECAVQGSSLPVPAVLQHVREGVAGGGGAVCEHSELAQVPVHPSPGAHPAPALTFAHPPPLPPPLLPPFLAHLHAKCLQLWQHLFHLPGSPHQQLPHQSAQQAHQPALARGRVLVRGWEGQEGRGGEGRYVATRAV